MVLRLVVVEDHCTRGMAGWDLLKPVKAAYRLSCWMHLTAYYSSPLPSDETITRILDAGQQALSAIPFTHHNAHEDIQGQLTHAGHTLTRDQSGSQVPELEQPANAYRFVCEPPTASVVAIRRRYGTVFALTLPQENYYQIAK